MADDGAPSFLDSPDFPFHGEFKDWFVANGVWFDSVAPCGDNPLTRSWRKRRSKIDQCFAHAQQFCLEHGGARYFEGVIMEGQPILRPVLHAWVVVPDGEAVDFARAQATKKKGTPV